VRPAPPNRLTPGYFQPGTENATAEDVLTNHRDNSLRCREIEARYLGLIEWAEGLPWSANATEAPK